MKKIRKYGNNIATTDRNKNNFLSKNPDKKSSAWQKSVAEKNRIIKTRDETGSKKEWMNKKRRRGYLLSLKI